jgi:hypothetical protein
MTQPRAGSFATRDAQLPPPDLSWCRLFFGERGAGDRAPNAACHMASSGEATALGNLVRARWALLLLGVSTPDQDACVAAARRHLDRLQVIRVLPLPARASTAILKRWRPGCKTRMARWPARIGPADARRSSRGLMGISLGDPRTSRRMDLWRGCATGSRDERALPKIRRAFRQQLFSPLRSNGDKDGTIIGLTGREEERGARTVTPAIRRFATFDR